jgi:hypothetical protein
MAFLRVYLQTTAVLTLYNQRLVGFDNKFLDLAVWNESHLAKHGSLVDTLLGEPRLPYKRLKESASNDPVSDNSCNPEKPAALPPHPRNAWPENREEHYGSNSNEPERPLITSDVEDRRGFFHGASPLLLFFFSLLQYFSCSLSGSGCPGFRSGASSSSGTTAHRFWMLRNLPLHLSRASLAARRSPGSCPNRVIC